MLEAVAFGERERLATRHSQAAFDLAPPLPRADSGWSLPIPGAIQPQQLQPWKAAGISRQGGKGLFGAGGEGEALQSKPRWAVQEEERAGAMGRGKYWFLRDLNP